MKKILLIITALFLSISLYSQNSENHNRLLLHHSSGDIKGFIIENIDSLTFTPFGTNLLANINIGGSAQTYNINNIDSISFASITGEVAAKINIIDFTLNSITLDITRTPSCTGFKITCVPSYLINSLSDESIAQYIDSNTKDIYYQDFVGAELTGTELSPGTEYVVLTVAFDKYGVLCDVSKEKFTTQPESVIGNPKVDVEIVENNLYDFTIKFTPNEDVSKYYVIVGKAGALESQYSMFASSFGWTSIGDMIEEWGLDFIGEQTYQWTDKSPNTEYEVFIQARDIENNRAAHRIFKFKTASNGGDGIAEVAITLGEYTLNDWYGEMLPSQFITFTPNEHTSAYRINVVLAENYNSDPEGYKENLCSEPFMPTDGWFQYETLTTDFQINPNLDCVAIAAAKNANGEWGPISELFFTTPAEVEGKSFASAKNIMQRFNKAGKSKEEINFINGMIPLILK